MHFGKARCETKVLINLFITAHGNTTAINRRNRLANTQRSSPVAIDGSRRRERIDKTRALGRDKEPNTYRKPVAFGGEGWKQSINLPVVHEQAL